MFIFISGLSPKIEEKESDKEIYCFHCHNTKKWILRKETSWISLFFIPIFPLKPHYSANCPICGLNHIITREEFEAGLHL
ncbi:MAG: zinc-ribbon domain-containing protein [Bacteroidota bacterium]|nr:zinc-ribbon domain-containing protein [Bacteroidota bacterium]MDP4204783.1 zinc-ribbon domain-containing protein [Bacteroidota bacterium]